MWSCRFLHFVNLVLARSLKQHSQFDPKEKQHQKYCCKCRKANSIKIEHSGILFTVCSPRDGPFPDEGGRRGPVVYNEECGKNPQSLLISIIAYCKRCSGTKF